MARGENVENVLRKIGNVNIGGKKDELVLRIIRVNPFFDETRGFHFLLKENRKLLRRKLSRYKLFTKLNYNVLYVYTLHLITNNNIQKHEEMSIIFCTCKNFESLYIYD